ncbi:MAG: hypothetical protein QOD06_3191 [Candidatus Binatota bacterium]|nr:hypothetical protein [Candidatus Binatota bacterium]
MTWTGATGTIGTAIAVSAALVSLIAFALAVADRMTRTAQRADESRGRFELERLARAEAERAELRYREFLQGLDAIVWEAQRDPVRFTFVSERARKILGYRIERWLMEPDFWMSRVHPEDRDRVARSWESARDGQSFEVEYRALAADGRVVWLDETVRVIADDRGGSPRLHGLIVDVTERKLAEQRLAAQHGVTAVLADAASLTDAAPSLLAAMCDNLGWEVGALWIVDRRTQVLRPVDVCVGPTSPGRRFAALSRSVSFPKNVGLPGRIWKTGEAAWIEDVLREPNFPRAPTAVKDGLHTAFAFPICLGKEFLGVLEFFSREIRPPDDAVLRMARAIGAQIGQFVERTRVEEEVRRSEERLRLALEAAATWTWEWDLSAGDLVCGIDAGVPLEGRTYPEFLRSVHPDDRTLVTAAVQRSLTEGSDYDLEHRIVARDGRERWIAVKGRARTDASGSARRMAGVAADISARKAMEAQLRDETEALDRLNRIGQILSAELSLENLAQALADTATKLTGATAGAFFYDGGAPRDGSGVACAHAGDMPVEELPWGSPGGLQDLAAADERPLRVDDVTADPRFRPSDGASTFARAAVRSYLAVPVISRSAELLGGLFVGHPRAGVFGERHERLLAGLAAQAAIALDNARLYEAERRARADAERANRTKDEFLAMLGHELRNPIGAIANSVRALQTPGAEERHDELLAVIGRQTLNLKRLVDDLLDVSRLTSGKIELRQEPVDIEQVAVRCISTLGAAGIGGGHCVSFTSEPAVVQGDATRLEQILTNLLDNSVKYTPEGGSIHLQVARHDGEALITIEDDGIGIPAEILPRIFDVFAQGEQPIDRSRGGLGLGLTLVRRLAELHGGSVHAESEGPGRGSRFTVRLPLRGPAPAPRGAPPPASATAPRRILVIEDHADAREALRSLLELAGHRVEAVGEGERGVELALSSRPDVALVDIGLPGIDGYEVARRIRSAEGPAPIFLVALTGYGQPFDRRHAFEAGFDRHLVKPLDYDELTRILAGVGSSAPPADQSFGAEAVE